VYGKRMDTGFELVGESLINHAMASDPALPPERISHDINPEMRFSAWPMSGVAFMLMGFIEHLQSQRSEGLRQLPRNGFLHTHLKIVSTRIWSQRVDGAFTLNANRHPRERGEACPVMSVKLARCRESSA
jgi:hypothetical protein